MPRLNFTACAAISAVLLASSVAIGTGCNTNNISTTQVDFYGPAGLAIAPARDRDLLIIASTGGNDLKALSICNTPSPTDGGAAVTTCTDNEDFHLLPGPIRVFPASFPVDDRPLRLASVNLRDADGGVVGGVLVAGIAAYIDEDGGVADSGVSEALPALKLVDTVNLLDATKGAATIKVPGNIPLDGPPIDVVSVQLDALTTPGNGAAQQAFVLTQANLASGIPAEISQIAMTPSDDGPVATLVGRCSLDILATRLALIPGQSDPLYVGDGSTDNVVPGGRGDGALEISTANASIPPISAAIPPCTVNRRLPATDPATGLARGLTALALSPAYSSNEVLFTTTEDEIGADGGIVTEPDGGPVTIPTTVYRDYPAGALLLGVSTDGVIAFIRTDTGVAPAIPPFESLRDGGTFATFVSNGVTQTAYVLDDGGVVAVVDGGLSAPIDGLAAQPMEPLRVNALAREITFLKNPPSCPAGYAGPAPCIYVEVGSTENTSANTVFPLIAVVTSTDGSAVFIDADEKRFLSDLRDATPGSVGFQAAVDTSYSFSPAQPNDIAAPVLNFANADTSSNECNLPASSSGVSGAKIECRPLGWSAAGVARQTAWRAVFHAQVQGLERQGGTLTVEDSSHVRFTMPGVDTTRWTNPLLNDALDVGDVVSFAAFSTADNNATLCSTLVMENLNPLIREFTITAIGNTTDATGAEQGYFILQSISPAPYNMDSGQTLNLADPIGADGGVDNCYPTSDPNIGLGAVVEVRYANGLVSAETPTGRPWLIYQGNLIHGRAENGVQFVGTETRFDYPLQYQLYLDNLSLLPTIANDIGVAFTITGNDPITAQATLAWTVASGQSPTRVSDTNALGGFAGSVISYNSIKIPGNLVFFSSTGTNSVIQVDPALIGITNGILEYR